jgi:peptidoglycan/LPS O-acetylase OafA/YrhL
MQLDLIRRHRTEIMGIAILWIVLYHSSIDFGSKSYSILPSAIKLIGYGGVDLFFFLSGFGLVFGWLKQEYKVSDFYKKRLLRIVPTYWVALLISLLPSLILIKDFKSREFMADILGLGFLTSKSYNFWFVPAIIICYLVFPFLFYFVNRFAAKKKLLNNFFSMLCLATFLPLIICAIASLTNKYQLLIFFVRLPSFIIGILIGYSYFENKVEDSQDLGMNNLNIAVILITSAGALIAIKSLIHDAVSWRYGVLWYPFVFLTFPLCLVIAYLFDRFNSLFLKFFGFRIIKKFLTFCGSYSFEIYLSHCLVFKFENVFISSNTLLGFYPNSVLLHTTMFVFSLAFAFLIKQITNVTIHLISLPKERQKNG